ncbi:MAG: hypothetical protein C0511_08455 [Hyphomicrobium sp.]|nr:hypothetical protein [Hyphomicrobium sp.]
MIGFDVMARHSGSGTAWMIGIMETGVPSKRAAGGSGSHATPQAAAEATAEATAEARALATAGARGRRGRDDCDELST